MGVKSSEKGDEKEVSQDLTKSVSENPITVDQLSNEDLAKMVLELKGQLDEVRESNTRTFEDDDEYNVIDDYMDVPAVFFCFSQEYNVHGDVRQGREILPPLGFVKFKPVYRYHRKAARGVDVIAVSQTVIRSKEQTEWMRNHSLMGIKFFENIEDVRSIDTTFAEKMAEQSSRISRMSDLQIIERAKAENIPVHEDIAKLRKQLVQKLAQADIMKADQKKSAFFSAERDDKDRIVVDKTGDGQPDNGEVY